MIEPKCQYNVHLKDLVLVWIYIFICCEGCRDYQDNNKQLLQDGESEVIDLEDEEEIDDVEKEVIDLETPKKEGDKRKLEDAEEPEKKKAKASEVEKEEKDDE